MANDEDVKVKNAVNNYLNYIARIEHRQLTHLEEMVKRNNNPDEKSR